LYWTDYNIIKYNIIYVYIYILYYSTLHARTKYIYIYILFLLPPSTKLYSATAVISCLTFRRSREKQTPVASRVPGFAPCPLWWKGTDNENWGGSGKERVRKREREPKRERENDTTRNASWKIIHHLDCLWEREEKFVLTKRNNII